MGEKPKPWWDHRGCSHPCAGHSSSKQGSCSSLGNASLDKPSKTKAARRAAESTPADMRQSSGAHQAGLLGAQGKAHGLHCGAGLPQEPPSTALTWGAGPPATPHSPVLITISQGLSFANQPTTNTSPPRGAVHNPLAADFRLPRPLWPGAELQRGSGSSSSEGLARKHSGCNSNALTPPAASHSQTKLGQAFYIHQCEGEGKTLKGLNNLSASLTDADIFDTC